MTGRGPAGVGTAGQERGTAALYVRCGCAAVCCTILLLPCCLLSDVVVIAAANLMWRTSRDRRGATRRFICDLNLTGQIKLVCWLLADFM